ncbi:MAG: HAMP domain-containing sensor histidine kinase, partial [Burkholderiaceae bacterium]
IAVVALAFAVHLPGRGSATPAALAVAIAFPALTLAAGCAGLMLAAPLRIGRGWPVWTLTAALAAQGGLWMEWNAMRLAGAPAGGGGVEAAFAACALLGGLAVSSWRVDGGNGSRHDRLCDGAARVLPLIVVVGAGFAATMQRSLAPSSLAAQLACDAATALVVALAAIRQAMLVRDRDQLADARHRLRDREDELGELNQHLEQRVSDRTREAELRNAELSVAMQQLSMAQRELMRSEKLAGLGALVAGVAEEMSVALGNATMVMSTLEGQLDALGRLHSRAVGGNGQGPAAQRRGDGATGHVQGLDRSHKQLAQWIAQTQRVVDGFRQLAADQSSNQRRHFDLLAMVRELVELTRLSHRRDPIELIVTGEADLMLDSYPGPLGQVLGQLLENAVMHGFANRREGTIDIRVWPSGRDAARITVHDDGAGIPAADLPHVFAPFFTTRLAEGGSGLGLTVCRNMVNSVLGGRIEVTSPSRAGTTVTVTLPRAAPRPSA